MALSIVHSTVATLADQAGVEINKAEWNAGHSLTGLGTGVQTALETNVGSAGAPVVLGGALGTPSSGVATNMTGLTYALQFGATAYNPVDAQTTYHGMGGTISTTAAVYTVPVPKAGTITDVFVDIGVAGTLGTTEQATIAIGVNNSSYTTISAVAQFNAARQQYSITGQAITVAAGDFLQLRCANPTWVTNPLGVNLSASVIVRTT